MSKSKPNSTVKQEQMTLELPHLKKIEQNFDGGQVCTDGGLLILRKADERLELTELASYAIADKRRPEYVQHKVVDLIRQRIYAIAAGFEDCNDASKLRADAMHQLAVGRSPASGQCLASQPSLSRFEYMADATTNAALQKLLVHLYVRRQRKAPKVLRLAMDTTCDEAYGSQQYIAFNGYYGAFCYAPLFIFTEDGFPLCALLRSGSPSPIDDAIRMLKQVLREIRLSWPDVRIEITADAAFASSEMFDFLEDSGVTYHVAAIGHSGLAYHAQDLVFKCKKEFDEFGFESPELKKYGLLVNPKDRLTAWRRREERIRSNTKEEGRLQEFFEGDLHIRKFGEFLYQSREWRSERRFVFRVDYSMMGPDTRFVVTNQKGSYARNIYETRYCPRAQCENWIKDLKRYLLSGRTSCQEFQANQFRLFLHVFAYILIWEVRKRAQLPPMTVETFRLRFLKIGVLVKETATRIRLHLASEFPWQTEFQNAWLNT
jgi:Transposase DDE domain group 1